MTPVTSAYAPKSSASASRVTPGQETATIPKTIARPPRIATAHQCLPRWSSMIKSPFSDYLRTSPNPPKATPKETLGCPQAAGTSASGSGEPQETQDGQHE